MADKKEFYVHMTTIIRPGVTHPAVGTNGNGTAMEPQRNRDGNAMEPSDVVIALLFFYFRCRTVG